MQSSQRKRKRNSPHFSLVPKKSRANTPMQVAIDSAQQTRRDLQDISTRLTSLSLAQTKQTDAHMCNITNELDNMKSDIKIIKKTLEVVSRAMGIDTYEPEKEEAPAEYNYYA
jgi:archaellum component FlaC